MYRTLKVYKKLKRLTYLTLTPSLACSRKKRLGIYRLTIYSWTLGPNSVVTYRLITPSLVVPFAYPDRSPLSAMDYIHNYRVEGQFVT